MSLTVHHAGTRLRSADTTLPAKPHWAFVAIKSAVKGLFTLAAPILILGAIIAFKTWMWWPQAHQ